MITTETETMVYMMRLVIFTAAAITQFLVASDPAYCPAHELTSCKFMKDEKCTRGLWHGIDSLEVFEITAINESAVRIESLNGSFTPTVATVDIRDMQGNPNPRNCVHAPPALTRDGNCTTTLHAHFSEVDRQVLDSLKLQSCGLIEWVDGFGLYGAWVHANLEPRSPPAAMCNFSQGTNLYYEVGASPPLAFTITTINATAARVSSLNGSFPETVASLYEIGRGGGKIAWRARLFDGHEYRGIMRSNGAGTTGCCELRTDKYGNKSLSHCPVLSWWSDSGDRSCWETALLPSEPEGACTE